MSHDINRSNQGVGTLKQVRAMAGILLLLGTAACSGEGEVASDRAGGEDTGVSSQRSSSRA
jgi:hypothetical protein